MAIIDNILRFAKGGASQSGKREYTDVRFLRFDAPISDRNAVLDAVSALYPIGSAGSSGANLTSVSVSQEAPAGWEAQLQYSSNAAATPPPPGGGGFLAWTADIRVGKWSQTKAVEFDTRSTGGTAPPGNPRNATSICNTVGDRLIPPLQISIYHPVLIIDLVSDAPAYDDIAKCGSVNMAATTLCGIAIPRYCAMLSDVSIVKRSETEWLNTYTFNLNFSETPVGFVIDGTNVTGFIEWVLNAGLNKKAAGVKVKIYENGEPATSPVPLDSGSAIIGVESGEASFHYLDFMPYRLIDFTTQLPDFPEKL